MLSMPARRVKRTALSRRCGETRGAPVGVVLPQTVGHEVMGIDWMKMPEISEATPPAYTEYIGTRLMEYLT